MSIKWGTSWFLLGQGSQYFGETTRHTHNESILRQYNNEEGVNQEKKIG